MEAIFNIAAQISTPLALGGFFAAVVFFVFKRVLTQDLLRRLTSLHSAEIIKKIIDKLFVLALVAMVLGFLAYILIRVLPENGPPGPTPPGPGPSELPAKVTLFERETSDGRTAEATQYHTGQSGSYSAWFPIQPTDGWAIVSGTLTPVYSAKATGGTGQFARLEIDTKDEPRFRVYAQPTSRHHGITVTGYVQFKQFRLIERQISISKENPVVTVNRTKSASFERIEVEYASGRKNRFTAAGMDSHLEVKISPAAISVGVRQ